MFRVDRSQQLQVGRPSLSPSISHTCLSFLLGKPEFCSLFRIVLLVECFGLSLNQLYQEPPGLQAVYKGMKYSGRSARD